MLARVSQYFDAKLDPHPHALVHAPCELFCSFDHFLLCIICKRDLQYPCYLASVTQSDMVEL